MSILKGGEDILSKGDETYNAAFLGADLELDGSRRRDVRVLWLFVLCQKKLRFEILFIVVSFFSLSTKLFF